MQRLRVASPTDETAAIAAAADVLRRGGVVAYPTDTLYGLAVDPGSDSALDRLFELKGRGRGQAFPLIAASTGQACAAAQLTTDDLRLARAFWPGPLALVVRARAGISPVGVAADGTVAMRVPAHPLARNLAAAFGGCITATSANRSGEPPTASADEVAASLGNRLDMLLDGGDAPGGAPSTIVSLVTGNPSLVRAGAIAWERVLESLEERP
jgi:L-threonylcarbamoyladenylate synthase